MGEDMQEDQAFDIDDLDDSGMATAIETAPAKRPSDRKPGLLPLYRVLLHNDDVNTVEHVVVTILKLTALSPEEAIDRTLEAHENKVALLLVTNKERAELYQEQFTSASLTVTIEPG